MCICVCIQCAATPESATHGLFPLEVATPITFGLDSGTRTMPPGELRKVDWERRRKKKYRGMGNEHSHDREREEECEVGGDGEDVRVGRPCGVRR
jgi:hypothetical protein